MSTDTTRDPKGDRAPVPDLTIMELGIAIVCTRAPTSAVDQVAAEIARWFGRPVTAAHVELPLQRLIARGDVVANASGFGATPSGQGRAEDAARALVRLFFRDRYFFDVAKLLEIRLVREDGNHAH